MFFMNKFLSLSSTSNIYIMHSILQGIRFVSWNEFLYHMLAKGEVEEVIARPDVGLVTIVLYDDAIVKGKRVSLISEEKGNLYES